MRWDQSGLSCPSDEDLAHLDGSVCQPSGPECRVPSSAGMAGFPLVRPVLLVPEAADSSRSGRRSWLGGGSGSAARC